jgi:hypothetical protein
MFRISVEIISQISYSTAEYNSSYQVSSSYITDYKGQVLYRNIRTNAILFAESETQHMLFQWLWHVKELTERRRMSVGRQQKWRDTVHHV